MALTRGSVAEIIWQSKATCERPMSVHTNSASPPVDRNSEPVRALISKTAQVCERASLCGLGVDAQGRAEKRAMDVHCHAYWAIERMERQLAGEHVISALLSLALLPLWYLETRNGCGGNTRNHPERLCESVLRLNLAFFFLALRDTKRNPKSWPTQCLYLLFFEVDSSVRSTSASRPSRCKHVPLALFQGPHRAPERRNRSSGKIHGLLATRSLCLESHLHTTVLKPCRPVAA